MPRRTPSTVRDGATVRVIAGELFGLTGPGHTHTPISYAHVTLDEGAAVSTALPAGHVVLAYPLTGGFRVGDTHGRRRRAGGRSTVTS